MWYFLLPKKQSNFHFCINVPLKVLLYSIGFTVFTYWLCGKRLPVSARRFHKASKFCCLEGMDPTGSLLVLLYCHVLISASNNHSLREGINNLLPYLCNTDTKLMSFQIVISLANVHFWIRLRNFFRKSMVGNGVQNSCNEYIEVMFWGQLFLRKGPMMTKGDWVKFSFGLSLSTCLD